MLLAFTDAAIEHLAVLTEWLGTGQVRREDISSAPSFAGDPALGRGSSLDWLVLEYMPVAAGHPFDKLALRDRGFVGMRQLAKGQRNVKLFDQLDGTRHPLPRPHAVEANPAVANALWNATLALVGYVRPALASLLSGPSGETLEIAPELLERLQLGDASTLKNDAARSLPLIARLAYAANQLRISGREFMTFRFEPKHLNHATLNWDKLVWSELELPLAAIYHWLLLTIGEELELGYASLGDSTPAPLAPSPL